MVMAVAWPPDAVVGGGLNARPFRESRIPELPNNACWRKPPAPVMKFTAPPCGVSRHTLKGRCTCSNPNHGEDPRITVRTLESR